MTSFLSAWPAIVWAAVLVAGSAVVAWLIAVLLFKLLCRIASHKSTILNAIVEKTRGPIKLILPLAAVLSVIPGLDLSPRAESRVDHALGIALIAAFAWLAVEIVSVLQTFVAARYALDRPDDLTARRIRTQTEVLHRIAVFVIALIAFAVALMSFPGIREIGASLLASAGLAGLVIGLAARPVIANLLAGIQLALSEPIRLGDSVIVEGEFGQIEEITTAYVVVRIWDLRRLVVPLSWFIEKPFQNWTRTSNNLLGTLYLYLDYNVPVQALRDEFNRVLHTSDMWDGKASGVQVTDARENSIQIRVLVSAANSGKLFDLQCYMREALIAFVQKNYPGSLPHIRAEISGHTAESPQRFERNDGAMAIHG